jgi:hypothetical protein
MMTVVMLIAASRSRRFWRYEPCGVIALRDTEYELFGDISLDVVRIITLAGSLRRGQFLLPLRGQHDLLKGIIRRRS